MITKLEEIISYETGCELLNKDPKQLPIVDHLEPAFAKDLMARYKLMVVVLAVNTLSGFKINYNEYQEKWSLYYWVKADAERPAGFGFSDSYAYYVVTGTFVGARLTVGSQKDALHLDKYFQPLFQDMLI